MEPIASRPWDVVLWGATGFTGRLVAEALAAGAPGGLRWALGGRDGERLERLRAGLGVDAGVVLADAHDPASLAALARSSRVVISTVGPYARHGTP
ncbi:MAG: saccharopine dehydrogenase NADP-binding domain-containing protein, partial [Trueperaceae bacterium]